METDLSVKKKKIQERLATITNLPTLPDILQRVKDEIRNPKSNAASVAKIINDDPSMSARILQVCNSPLYAGTETVTSLSAAIARMGTNMINNIALSTFAFSAFGKIDDGFNPKEFWRHCICVGLAVNVIYGMCKGQLKHRFTPDQLHLAGLLHDIGKLVLEKYFQEDFRAALKLNKETRMPLYMTELDSLGADHAQVGAWLGQKWKMAEDQIEAIRWHHEPDSASEPAQDLVMLCHAGNYVCNLMKLGDSGDTHSPRYYKGVWEKLNMTVDDLAKITEAVNLEAGKSEVLMTLLQ